MNITSQLTVCWHLIRREAIMVFRTWRTDSIDAIIMAAVAVITFGYFMPAMGMPHGLRVPLVIGSLVVSLIFFGYTMGSVVAIDLVSSRLWYYHAALPFSLWGLLIAKVFAFAFRMLLFVVPSGTFALLALNDPGAFEVKLFGLLPMLLLVSVNLGLLFCWAVLRYNPDGYFTNLWPRVLAPVYCFGCLFFTWKTFAHVHPRVALLLLINPMTYATEGLRGRLLPAGNYIAFDLCVVVLSATALLLMWMAHRALVTRLNPAICKGKIS